MPPTATYQEVARHFHSASPTGLVLGMWLAPARKCLKPLFSRSDYQGTTHNCSLLNFTTRWKRTFTPSSCAQVKRFDAKCWLSVIHLLRGIDNGHKINADKERLRTLHVDDLSPERFCMIRLEAFICCPELGKNEQKHLVSSLRTEEHHLVIIVHTFLITINAGDSHRWVSAVERTEPYLPEKESIIPLSRARTDGRREL